MSRTQKKALQLSPLEKQVVDLKKLHRAKSHLKPNEALDKWLDSQIQKREAKMRSYKREEGGKYMATGESDDTPQV
jgi:hypothetical protein